MVPPNAARDIEEARFQQASAARRHEIDLLWHRSQFFWAFAAIGFAGFGYLAQRGDHELAILVANFGLVGSAAWTITNRGSKFWYEVWESRVNETERAISGKLFAADIPASKRTKHHHSWLKGRHLSVSRALIAVSDFAVLAWLAAIIDQVWHLFGTPGETQRQVVAVASVAFTVVYVVVVWWLASRHGEELERE